MAELVFERTCNYWIDAGIAGLNDTLQKPLPRNNGGLGNWEETIKGHSKIRTRLSPDALRLEGEEKQIDQALSYALEWVRLTLYDVSKEDQINKMAGVYYNESEGIVYFPMSKPIPAAELVLESPRYTGKRGCEDQIVSKQDFLKLVEDVDGLFSDLVKKGYINEGGITDKKFFKLKDASSMVLADSFSNKKNAIYETLRQGPRVLPEKINEELEKIKGAIRSKKYQIRKNSCFPFFIQDLEDLSFCDGGDKAQSKGYCVACGSPVEGYKKNELKRWLSGEAKNFMPFVEGREANRCFHSAFKESQKCWKCGFATFFSPLLLFYRRRGTDTYYILPYVPGNLRATHLLYRSLSGKRGLARVLGSDHTSINYESAFKTMPMPRGMPLFTLSFYYDLYSRLLPQNAKNLLQASEDLGLIDERGAVFQASLFLKRDTTGGGGKSFILRETTIDRSAYFIKLFTHLSKNREKEQLINALQALMKRAIKPKKGEYNPYIKDPHLLQNFSVLRACQAMVEGRYVFRFLLPILSRGLEEPQNDNERYKQRQAISENELLCLLFQVYDQWLFRKEDKIMANMVEQANNAGYHLSRNLWKLGDMDDKRMNDKEKQNLVKTYYYAIERAPSPVKFLEQARHAYHKAGEGIPREMVFHDENGKDDIKKFEVYRVYFLAGMLNGMLKTQASATDTSQEAQKKEE